MTTTPPVTWKFGPCHRHVRDARMHVQETLVTWGYATLIDEIVLCVSEAVTNAYKYGLPPVTVTMAEDSSLITVTVHDHGHFVPAQRPAGLYDERNRGLGIIHRFTTDMAFSDDDGTTLTFSFSTSGHAAVAA
jgi:anti-sigma regulatory factor (Ser/Thr protein kinase)